jgi:hypothetical protein
MLALARRNEIRWGIVARKRRDQPLFESVSDDGTRWLFIVLPNDGWEITRNGETVDSGSGELTSIDAGLTRFLSVSSQAVAARRAPSPAS